MNDTEEQCYWWFTPERNPHGDALCLDTALLSQACTFVNTHGTVLLKFMQFTLCKFCLEKSTINKPWPLLNNNRDPSVLERTIQMSAAYLEMHQKNVTGGQQKGG